MVDLRIYRAGAALVVIAVIVFAFSLQNQPGGATTVLAPGAYFSTAAKTTRALARDYPNRTPGGVSDQSLARHLADVLSSPKLPGFAVSTSSAVAWSSLWRSSASPWRSASGRTTCCWKSPSTRCRAATRS